MTESSPIRSGFSVINQNFRIPLIEIAWRWSFGLVATLVLFFGARAFVAGLRVTEADEQAVRGHDPTLVAAALTHILQQAGVLQSLFSIVMAIAVPGAIVWIIAASLGRAATLRQLMPAAAV